MKIVTGKLGTFVTFRMDNSTWRAIRRRHQYDDRLVASALREAWAVAVLNVLVPHWAEPPRETKVPGTLGPGSTPDPLRQPSGSGQPPVPGYVVQEEPLPSMGTDYVPDEPQPLSADLPVPDPWAKTWD